MQIRVISSLFIFCACLASCSFFGKKEKTIVAEVFSNQDYYSADAKALQKNNLAEVNRIKKLVVNEELLRSAIEKSGFKHSVDEVKEAISFKNPENTTIVEIRYSAEEMKGAATFLDTLVANLVTFDLRDEFQRSDKAIREVTFRLDSVGLVLQEYKYKEITSEHTKKAEDLFIELMQRKANLVIEKARIVPRIRVLSWAREEL
jgi:hypothetical protein